MHRLYISHQSSSLLAAAFPLAASLSLCAAWLSGFCGAFCHCRHNSSFSCEWRSEGLSAFSSSHCESSYSLNAAFSRFSGWRSSSSAPPAASESEPMASSSERADTTPPLPNCLSSSSLLSLSNWLTFSVGRSSCDSSLCFRASSSARSFSLSFSRLAKVDWMAAIVT